MPDADDTTTEPDASTTTPDAPDAAQPKETDWKAEARKWEARAKENFKALEEAKPKLSEYDRLVEASKSDLERANEAAQRWQQETERWRQVGVSSRVQALAGDFADPSDALTALGDKVNNYIDAGGTINDDAIKTDLAELLDKKPHWRKATEAPKGPRAPAPNTNQGSGGGSKPALTARDEFAQILQAGLRIPQ